MKQEVYNNTTEFVSCWLATLGNGACPEMCIYQMRLHWGKVSFPFSLVSVSDDLSLRGENLCPLLLLSDGICLDCICARLRCTPQSMIVLMCISPLEPARQWFYWSL